MLVCVGYVEGWLCGRFIQGLSGNDCYGHEEELKQGL